MNFLENLVGICIISSIVFFHEFGHYITAKKQGIYKKIGIIPGLGFSVNMTQNYKRRIDYLSGLIFSFIAFPFFLLGIKFGAFEDARWWVFIVFAFALAIWDIVLFFFVGKQFIIKKKNKFTDLLAKLKIIAYGPEFEDVDQILKDIVKNGGCVFRDNVTVIEKKITKLKAIENPEYIDVDEILKSIQVEKIKKENK